MCSCTRLIGRERLSSWLELMFYAGEEKNVLEENTHAKQITQQALHRGYLMEELAYMMKKSTHFAHSAYVTGILSMADSMFHENFTRLLEQIKVDYHIADALLRQKGELGQLLQLVIAIEKNDLLRISALILETEISERSLNKALLDSYRRASMALDSPVRTRDLSD